MTCFTEHLEEIKPNQHQTKPRTLLFDICCGIHLRQCVAMQMLAASKGQGGWRLMAMTDCSAPWAAGAYMCPLDFGWSMSVFMDVEHKL